MSSMLQRGPDSPGGLGHLEGGECLGESVELSVK